MSGTNPFRRKIILTGEPDTSHRAESYGSLDQAPTQKPAINTDVARPVKKTVRIISPHSASENEQHIPHALFSPPPRLANSAQVPPDSPDSSGGSSPADPFDIESSDDGRITTEDEELRRNTLSNVGALEVLTPVEASMPLNSFPRPSPGATVNVQPGIGSGNVEHTAKPHYSVDEFKNLLLTGKKVPTESPLPTPPPLYQSLQSAIDSSSSTDASSISRQSIFEPLQHDTPRSSHEISFSEDERMRSVNPSSLNDEKVKPLTPRSHHGRFMNEIAPQKVAFESPTIGPTALGSASGLPSPGLARIPTDLNKPLPLPPAGERPQTDPLERVVPYPAYGSIYEPSSPTQKREPPALPLSRRQSQRRPKSLLNNPDSPYGSSDLTPLDQNQRPLALGNETVARSSLKQPPPPPPRRPGPTRGLSESSSASAISTATPTSSSFTDDSTSNMPKQRPPVPPSRNRSTSSAKRSSRIVSQSGSPNLPPAPPPRRRGSSQSSSNPFPFLVGQQQSEIERQRSDSATSSIQSKDIMTDLSALQKEVDALRGKFRD